MKSWRKLLAKEQQRSLKKMSISPATLHQIMECRQRQIELMHNQIKEIGGIRIIMGFPDKGDVAVASGPAVQEPLVFVGVRRFHPAAPPIAIFRRGPVELTTDLETLQGYRASHLNLPDGFAEAIEMLEAMSR